MLGARLRSSVAPVRSSMSPTPSPAQDPAAADAAPATPPAPSTTAVSAAGQEKTEAALLSVGTTVRLRQRPRYLRSADPMPMLRPPDLIDADECGLVVEQRALMQLAVRFRRGTFLLESAQLEVVGEGAGIVG